MLSDYVKYANSNKIYGIILMQMIRNRNTVEIQKICPSMPKNELNLHNKNAILGISINSPAIMGNKILAIFNFLNKWGLTEINLFLGDSLYRYTAMIKYQCDEEEGQSIAITATKQLIAYYQNLIKSDGSVYSLNYFYASDIIKEQQFHFIYKKLWELFEIYPEFRISVLNFTNYYFKQAIEMENNTNKKYTYLSYKYLIEELAIFAILNQRGFNTLLYPGVIQTIYDVIAMKHPYLLELFKEYTFVSLRIKRK